MISTWKQELAPRVAKLFEHGAKTIDESYRQIGLPRLSRLLKGGR